MRPTAMTLTFTLALSLVGTLAHASTITIVNLARGANGLWRPATNSPVRGAAKDQFDSVKTDMDGQLRPPRKDIGADQLSEAPVTSRPLSAADVGPSWMKRTANE